MAIERIDYVPAHPELTPEQARARTIEKIKGQVVLAAKLLDFFVAPLPPEAKLQKMYVGKAYIVDENRQPVIDDDGQPETSSYYKLWSTARDFRILEDGRFARLHLEEGKGVTPYQELQERGGDDTYVINDIDKEFANTSAYPQYVLDDLTQTLETLSKKFQDDQEVPVDNALNLF